MEEQRQRYGPPLYSLTKMLISIRVFLFLLWARFGAQKMTADQLTLLEGAANTYTCEFERFITFMGEVFANSPFFISADEVGALESRNDDYKERSIPAGKTHELLCCLLFMRSTKLVDVKRLKDSIVKGQLSKVKEPRSL